MNKKKILYLVLILLFLVVIGVLVFMKPEITENTVKEEEITPLEEVTEEEERETMISLYFKNPETNTLVPEARKIDAKKLIDNPYQTLIEYIIDLPKNEKLVSAIPNGTKVNSVNVKNGTAEVNLSKEFADGLTDDTKELSIYAIVNTLTELNDVNSVKILIDGEENANFNEIYARQD